MSLRRFFHIPDRRISQTHRRRRRGSAPAQSARCRLAGQQLESRTLLAGDVVTDVEALVGEPTLAPIADVTLLGGSPLHIPLDGLDLDGQNLTYTAESDNPLVSTFIPQGNRSMRIDVKNVGTMVFELFEGRAPRVTGRIIQLAESNFYDGILFHRVIDGFVLQGGDPTGTGGGGSTLGNFDDQFHVDLQHNRSGVLSMAKTNDDTNDSQFFITEVATRLLDFNHSIFGQLIEGEDVRELISTVPTDANDRPLVDMVMESVEIFVDNENGVLMLKAPEGASGQANITVTVTDESNNTFQRVFHVTVVPDPFNGAPFLEDDIADLHTTIDTPVQRQLAAVDVEGHPMYFDAVPVVPTNMSVVIDHETGLLTVTPPVGFVGLSLVAVGVTGLTPADTGVDIFDLQFVPVVVTQAIQLDSYGQTLFEDFDGLGAVGSGLPTGWIARSDGTVNATIREAIPTATVIAGTYNAGVGGDRTLATGNTDSDAQNSIELSATLSDAIAVRAVVLETRVEAWYGDAAADNLGEAAVIVSLAFDAEKDGSFSTAETFNGGSPITTGLSLAPGALDGNGVAGTTFDSGLVILSTPIPAGSNIRLTFDAQGVGQTTGYIFGVDDVLFRIVAPGDTDGNGEVDSNDLFAILGAGKFNHPELGPATWSEGDFNGDTLVDSEDLFLMLGAAKFNQGPYTASSTTAGVDSVSTTSTGDSSGDSATADYQQTSLSSQLLVAPADETATVQPAIVTTSPIAGEPALWKVRGLAASDDALLSSRGTIVVGQGERLPATLQSDTIVSTEAEALGSLRRGEAVAATVARNRVDRVFGELASARSQSVRDWSDFASGGRWNTVRGSLAEDSWPDAVDIALGATRHWLP